MNRRSDEKIKAGFVAMFVLSLVLVLITGLLACSAACSGYGFLAGVVSVLGLGFLASGLYFLGRAGDKPIRDWGQPTPPERRRNVRRFWLVWAVLTVAAGLIHLVISNSFRLR